MFGSITLNHPVGGLNPAALEVALKLGAKVVWLPTQHAQNHLAKFGKNPDDGVKVTENGKIVPEMKDIFQLVKDYDAVLGTAHISPEESFIVCDAARAAGVKKLVVTHPEWWVVDMSIEGLRCSAGTLLCTEHGRRQVQEQSARKPRGHP